MHYWTGPVSPDFTLMNPNSATTAPFDVGPRESIDLPAFNIPPEANDAARATPGYLIVWGSARDHGALPGGRPHITRFCYAVTWIGAAPGRPVSPLDVRTNWCAEGNCTDADCVARGYTNPAAPVAGAGGNTTLARRSAAMQRFKHFRDKSRVLRPTNWIAPRDWRRKEPWMIRSIPRLAVCVAAAMLSHAVVAHPVVAHAGLTDAELGVAGPVDFQVLSVGSTSTGTTSLTSMLPRSPAMSAWPMTGHSSPASRTA